MLVADLGEFRGDVIAFGGTVSNAHALMALVGEAVSRGLTGADAVATGDHVAYCAQPAETVAGLRAFGALTIAGNCEAALAEDRADCGCGFGEGTACDLASGAWFAHARAAFGAEERAWAAGLPGLGVFRAHGLRWGVIHGGAGEANRFIWPTASDDVLAEEIALFERLAGPVDGILAGHSGLPFKRNLGPWLWVNAGSLGLPPNDGDPRTSFAVIGPREVELRRMPYDHRAAAAEMRAAGLVQGYERCLETGWWPSEEMLPSVLCRQGPGG